MGWNDPPIISTDFIKLVNATTNATSKVITTCHELTNGTKTFPYTVS